MNAKGERFKIKKSASYDYQPYEVRRYIKALNLGAGLNIKGLQESFIDNA